MCKKEKNSRKKMKIEFHSLERCIALLCTSPRQTNIVEVSFPPCFCLILCYFFVRFLFVFLYFLFGVKQPSCSVGHHCVRIRDVRGQREFFHSKGKAQYSPNQSQKVAKSSSSAFGILHRGRRFHSVLRCFVLTTQMLDNVAKVEISINHCLNCVGILLEMEYLFILFNVKVLLYQNVFAYIGLLRRIYVTIL